MLSVELSVPDQEVRAGPAIGARGSEQVDLVAREEHLPVVAHTKGVTLSALYESCSDPASSPDRLP